MNFKEKTAPWPTPEQVAKLRKELHERILSEDIECSWQLEAVDRLIDLSQMDTMTFHRLWIEPLLNAGASLEVATGCIVRSYLQPN